MSDFTKRKHLSEENPEETVNYSNYDHNNGVSGLSSENISTPISFKSEEDDCSDDETESDIEHGKWTEPGIELLCFTFIGKMGLKVEILKSENPLECFEIYITPNKYPSL